MLKKNNLTNDYILVIPSWYPTRINRFNGDFNQRTVEALSAYKRQVVIYVVGDYSANNFAIENRQEGEVTTIIGYFPKSKQNVVNVFRYIKYYNQLIKREIRERGKPLYLHTYVFFPAGLISCYYAKKLRLKSVLTEHWSAIYPDNEYSLSKKSFLIRSLTKYLLKSFDLILPVVEALKEAISYWSPNTEKVIVPNVVDVSDFYYDSLEKFEYFTFLHVSSMEAHKNPMGILTSFESKCKSNQNIRLKFIGPAAIELKNKVLGSEILKSKVDFLGEMPYNQVSEVMRKSHALIMNSFYESLPCVILEALCCGVPVLSSKVGGISEVIDVTNGVLFELGDLTSGLDRFFLNYNTYDCKKISKDATSKFSYHAVSSQISAILKQKKIIVN